MKLFYRVLLYAEQEHHFLKFAEICDARLLFDVFTVIFTKKKPDIFEIFRIFSRYLEQKSGISGNIFRRF